MNIVPFLRAGRSVYYISFDHPQTKKRINRSLKTIIANEAKQIALHVERICQNPDAWDITNPVLANFPDAAVRAFHGCSARIAPKTLALPTALVNAAALASGAAGTLVIENPAGTLDAETISDLRQQVIDRDIKIAHLEEELHGWRRRFNAHIQVQLGEAAEMWLKAYTRRAPNTTDDVTSRVAEFVAFVGPKTKLSDVSGTHVDEWLATYQVPRTVTINGKEKTIPALEPRSIRRRKGCVSVFFTWCVIKFKLYGNPIEHTQAVAGLPAEHIESIRRLDELNALLDTMTGYWRAVVAVGCLAGLRLAEIFWLKKSDLYLSEKYLRVTSREDVAGELVATKTGLERNVVIERTKLQKIVADFVASNGAGSWRDEWPWAFPSLAAEPKGPARKLTPPGLWCNGNNFRKWLAVALKEAQKAGPTHLATRDFWTYGAREWRHTAGTAMGLSGMSSLQISKMLGNTPDVCERHYIGVRAEDAGARWPFQW